MMICSYLQDKKSDGVIVPTPFFWDSFYLAGDDIVKRVIQHFVIDGEAAENDNVGSIGEILCHRMQKMSDEQLAALPIMSKNQAFEQLYLQIRNSIDPQEREKRIAEAAKNIVADFFGVDAAGMNYRDRLCRKDFNTQVSVPIASFFMEQLRQRFPSRLFSFDDIFSTHRPSDYLLDHFEQHFGFRFEEIEWRFRPETMSSIVSATLEPLMKQLSIILNAFNVDVLILAGRPASLDAVTDLFVKYYPVSPDRLIRLSQYHVGRWYPLATPKGYFIEQKSVVAVGAMVGYMASNKGFRGLKINLENLARKMHSTANYMGLYNPDSFKISSSLLTPSKNNGQIVISHFPAYVGCKQLDAPEYHARPIYAIENNSGITPLKFRIEREFAANREVLAITEVEDINGNPVDIHALELIQQSLVETSGSGSEPATFWMDSGAFRFLNS